MHLLIWSYSQCTFLLLHSGSDTVHRVNYSKERIVCQQLQTFAHAPECAQHIQPTEAFGVVVFLQHSEVLIMCYCSITAAVIAQSDRSLLHAAGGPYYAPRSVRHASLEVLDALFPMGRRSRRLVRLVFRVLHPAEFLGAFFVLLLLPVRFWTWASRRLISAIAIVLFGLLELLGRARGAVEGRRKNIQATAAVKPDKQHQRQHQQESSGSVKS